MKYVRRPCHFALGPKGGPRADSACGIPGLWHRGLNYTREIEQTTCGHCRRWLVRRAVAALAAERRVER